MSKQGTWSNVLVPLDGSTLAEAALEPAAGLAHRTQAMLHLVTVQVAPGHDARRAPDYPPTALAIRHDVREYLEAKAEALAITHGVRCTCAVLHGSPAEALAAYVREHGVALVVMTAHGRSGPSRCWIGSVADRLLRRVTAPVLLLRPDSLPMPHRFYRVLIALDGSAACGDVLSQAVELGMAVPDTEYVLVEVVEASSPLHPGPDPVGARARRPEAAATADLDRRAARLQESGVLVTSKVVIAERVGERLIELAATLGCDLIAVGTQRPRTPARPMLGSVADKVVRGATQPVLVVPLRRRSPRRGRRAGRHAAAAAG